MSFYEDHNIHVHFENDNNYILYNNLVHENDIHNMNHNIMDAMDSSKKDNNPNCKVIHIQHNLEYT